MAEMIFPKPIVPMDGATSQSAGGSGLVPAPSAGDNDKFLKGDGTWGTVDLASKLDASLKGAANGVAELDAGGKVPSSQLPSYVDDVLEYASQSNFPLTGETGKIYVALDTNKTFRWSGSAYVEISSSLALGETSSTAYRGDYGAAAYAAAVTNPDSAPTENSTNLVKSGGVYTELNLKAPKANPVFTGSINLGRKENTTVGNGSVAVGTDVIASSYQSHAEGYSTQAKGAQSHAEGHTTVASSSAAHAEGYNTTASGAYSHVEGSYSVASGKNSHAEGGSTEASGEYSHAEGLGTCANHKAQHSFGAYNVYDSSNANASACGNYIEIVGNGTAYNAHSNARTLDWDGNERLKGQIYVGCNADSSGGTQLTPPVAMTGATSSAAGTAGYVPAPASGDNEKYLKGDGTWGTVDIYGRHTRLTDFSISDLQSAVADQNLAKYGLKVGDEKTINGHTYVIAGLNVMKGSHDYTCKYNHVGLIVIPNTTCPWNESGDASEGEDDRGAGYLNCDLHYYLKNTVKSMCDTDLGSSHLYQHKKLMGSAFNQTGFNRTGHNTGCTSGHTFSDEYISALTEAQVYGGDRWSSSGYDTGEANTLLPVFAEYKYTDIFGDKNIWLRNVADSESACYACGNGGALFYMLHIPFFVAGLILYH